MTATEIRRVRISFLWIYFAPSQMFNVEISWNFDAGVQKNIFCFLSDFTQNIFKSVKLCALRAFAPTHLTHN